MRSSPTSKGNPVVDLKQDEFEVTEDGKPQKIETFRIVKIDAARSRWRPAAAADPHDRRRGARGRASGRAAVRHPAATTTTCGAATTWPCASRSSSSSRTSSRPADMVAIMYPLTPVTDLSFTRNREGADQRRSSSSKGASSTTRPRNEFEEQYAYYPARRSRRIRNQVAMAALEGAAARLGGAARGTQVDHLRQRGLHQPSCRRS